jgi:tRNA pseudouridine55 synthase
MRKSGTTIHGVLLLDKPAGLSSNAALQRTRKLFDWAKAGHTGTLDPLATGLLPVCLGEATKYSHALLDADKTYEAVIRLGFTSSTGDAEGLIQPVSVPDISEARLGGVLQSFLGTTSQVPPMHSALKRDGRPLYEYARAGEEIVREPRQITIKTLEMMQFTPPGELTIRVACSKGTYIRVLAEDIGKTLGCGGYLAGLRRTTIADLDISGTTTLEKLENLPPAARIDRLLPVDRLLQGLPLVILDAEGARRVCSGLPASAPGANPGLSRLYDSADHFLGMGEVGDGGTVSPKRMIANPEITVGAAAAARLSP